MRPRARRRVQSAIPIGECNRLERRLLASRQLVDRLAMPHDVTPKSMGLVELRGAGATEIVALA